MSSLLGRKPGVRKAFRAGVFTAFGLGVAALPTGCYSVSQGTVPANEVEMLVAKQLVALGNSAPGSVHCDGDLEKIRGRAQHCAVVIDGASRGITVIVSDVDEDSAGFAISLRADRTTK